MTSQIFVLVGIQSYQGYLTGLIGSMTNGANKMKAVVLVNCQLGAGAHEGQPGFTLVFAKAVLVHQWIQSARLFRSQSS